MSKIPPQANKVFEGVVFDVYQWEQELFDGRKTTFEMASRTGGSYVLPVIGDKLMLTKEQQPGNLQAHRGLIGGRLERGETNDEAAHRELLEETGMTAGSLTCFIEDNASDKLDWPKKYYIAKDCFKTQDVLLDGGELISLHLIDRDEFINLCINKDLSYTGLVMHVMYAKIHNKLDELKTLMFG